MYNNKYTVTWMLKNVKQRVFSQSDQNIVFNSVNDFNTYFRSATYEMTKNKKYISNVSFINNCVTIYFETQYALPDINRRGNALRMRAA